MSQKFNKALKYILTAALILIIVAIIFNRLKISAPKTNVNTKPSQNWTVFSSELHKFQIQYPADWLVQREVGHPPATIFSTRSETGSYCSMDLLIVGGDFDNSSEMDWYRQNGYREKSITFANGSATEFSKFPVPDSAPVAVIYFNKTSDRIDMIASADKYQDCMDTFNQMLASYKTLK